MFRRILNLSVLLISLVDLISTDDLYEVTTLKGTIFGQRKLSFRGRNFSAFEGIPYAKPPVGDLRFEDPEILGLPEGDFFANKTYTCLQYVGIKFIGGVHGTEDCLYLNIYVPREKITGNENLDVIVAIHGGGFMLGSPKMMIGPDYLMDKDVIYVSMSYRLSILGFMTTEDSVVPGNMGLKDQSVALRWIKNNIQLFGGNPNSVTLTGISAGGCSTHYHYLSPMSKGLFNRGFSQSGTALQSWSLRRNTLQYSKKMAEALKCDTSTSAAMVECLKKVDAHDLLKSTDSFSFFYGALPFLTFGPTIEKDSTNPFLDEHPYKLLKEGKLENDVPWISSNVKDEGIFPIGFVLTLGKIEEINLNWYDVMPYFLDIKDTVDGSNMNATLDKIKKKYISTDSITSDSILEIIKMCTDRLYFHEGLEGLLSHQSYNNLHHNSKTLHVWQALRLHVNASKSPVYTYEFDYLLQQMPVLPIPVKGVAHGDDGKLIFKTAFTPSKLDSEDEAMMDIMTKFIADYAADKSLELNGVPWKPVDPSSDYIDHMLIKGPGDIYMDKIKELCDNQFWDSLQIKENENEI